MLHLDRLSRCKCLAEMPHHEDGTAKDAQRLQQPLQPHSETPLINPLQKDKCEQRHVMHLHPAGDGRNAWMSDVHHAMAANVHEVKLIHPPGGSAASQHC
jgi:hypothetical protein